MTWFIRRKSHGRTIGITILLGLLISTMVCTCGVPIRNLEKEEIALVNTLKEMMWFLSTVNTKGFAIANSHSPENLSTDDFQILAEMGRRTTWAAKRLHEPRFSRGSQFQKLAAELHVKADDLSNNARLRKGLETIKASIGMEKTCTTCHTQNR